MGYKHPRAEAAAKKVMKQKDSTGLGSWL